MERPLKKLFLLDAYALIYRAHFAFTKNPRINSRGINTSIPFGFTNTLLEVLQKQKPTHIGVAFDPPGPTFRDEIFEGYKATRQETPEDVRYGLPKVKEILQGFNIPILEIETYEADDVIGTLAKQAVTQGFEVYMMTPDKDFGQLVQDNIYLYKPAYMGNAVDILHVKEVCEKWDIQDVGQVTDILGLQGDASDNIPGVPGIGPKTAALLLKQYGTVENIVNHASELKGKQKELMEKYGQQAILSKQLATIITDVPIEFNEEALRYKGPNAELLKPIFDEMEFKTLATRVFNEGGATTSKPQKPAQLSMFDAAAEEETSEDVVVKTNLSERPHHYVILNSRNDQAEFLRTLGQQPQFSIDLLLDPNSPEPSLSGLAFSYKTGESCFLNVKEFSLHQELKEILENKDTLKVGHNIKAVILQLKYLLNINLSGKLFDAMLAHYLIEPEAAHDLGTLANQFMNYSVLSDQEGNPVERVSERADVIFQLRDLLENELEKRGHTHLMNDIEAPLIDVLACMEFEGVKVDTEVLGKLSEELRLESEKVQAEIYTLAGTQFNIGSPKQLGEVLFEKMKLGDKPKKTKSGQYATGEDILLNLSSKHDIARKILDYREYEKLRSTYVDALPKMISKRDGRIHTDYRQAWAVTGRLSSNNPNLQNIPIRSAKGQQIRKAFVPRNKDFLFMSADYSQIELRIAAAFAKDETMIEAFRTGRDIHTTTAAKVFNVPIDKVDGNMRRKAKEVNFGILYGSTAFGLAQNLGISRSEAMEIINAYFNEFPAIKRFMDDSINKARELQYVETITGRRRYLRDINSRNITTRGFAERNAINAPIQGSAADIIKIAMVHIHRWINAEKLQTRMIMQVHDELVFDLHKDETEIVKQNVKRLMVAAATLEVPMEVEIGVAQNWLDAH